MKKTYQKPQMRVVPLKQCSRLLAGSYNNEIAQGGLLPMSNQDQWMQG